jgi:hypothetical protein
MTGAGTKAQDDSWHPYPQSEEEVQVMAEIRTGRAGEPSAWSTRDLMVISAIGVALGVVLVPVIYATMALHAALAPLGMATIWGLYVVPLLVTTRIMRRPGAALLTSLLVPLVQLPFGPGGWRADGGASATLPRPHQVVLPQSGWSTRT